MNPVLMLTHFAARFKNQTEAAKYLGIGRQYLNGLICEKYPVTKRVMSRPWFKKVKL